MVGVGRGKGKGDREKATWRKERLMERAGLNSDTLKLQPAFEC